VRFFSVFSFCRPGREWREALRTHGWLEGQNLTIEYRFGGDDYEYLRTLADDLVQLKVDVIYAATAPSAQAAKTATREIPIVFHTLNDPVRAGLVASFSRPGGNLTGNAGVRPSLAVVTILINPRDVMTTPRLGVVQEAARALKLQTRAVEPSDQRSLDQALQSLARSEPAGLIVFEDPIFSINRRRILDFAAKERVTALYTQSGWADEGGLVEYAPNQNQLRSRGRCWRGRIR
jgi:putative ABC transport system substrate-binding protein